MSRRLPLALALLAAPAAARDDAASDLARLRGTWVTERSTRDGKASPAERGVRLVVAGDRVRVHEPGRREPVTMTLHASKGTLGVFPHRAAPEPGSPYVWPACALRMSYGRYELDGDRLTVVIQSAYSVPKDFSDRDQVRWVLRRVREE